jgi:phosphoesterase RecJ-like protein
VNDPSASSPADAPRAEVDWPRFVALVHAHRRFLLTTHVRPDGDAIGSTVALAAVLEQLGKEVRIAVPFELPPGLRFLDPEHKVQRLSGNPAVDRLDSVEVLIVLDTCAWAQLGEMAEVVRTIQARKLVFDHHASFDDLGAEMFKDVGAEAAGRLVYDAAVALGVPLTPRIAVPLFAALATDTGWFRFASTSADTYELASRLVRGGAVPDRLYKEFYENDSLGRLRLIGRAMGRVATEMDGRLIHTWISRDDFAAAGAIPPDSEDIINMTLAVGGTEAAVIFVEQPRGGFKISFRSRCALDCSRLAERFGGGGHRAAAGAYLAGSLKEVQAQVLDAVREAMP